MTRYKHTKFDPKKHHRRSIRLRGYDYCVGGLVPPTRYAAGTKPAARQAGAYYVTIVTYHRDCLFGEIVNKEMILNDFGKIADECWRAIPDHFPLVELGAYVIMPNHVHGIIFIVDNRRGTIHRAPTIEQFGKPTVGSLPTIVRTYKAAVTRRIGREHNATGIWQRNYYEHIIRDEKDLQNKSDYIDTNPSLWDEDDNNPHNAQLP